MSGMRRTGPAFRFAAWGLACCGAGCASTAEIPAPGATPPPSFEGSTPQAAPPPPTDWWTSFGDPGLDRIVAEALARNPTLERAAARLEAAAADSERAVAGFFPTAGVSARRAQQRQNFIGLPLPGLAPDEVLSTTFTNYGASLDVSWEANLWRAASPGVRAAAAGLQSVIAETAGTRIAIAGQAAKAWFAAVSASEQERVARRLAEGIETSLERTRVRAERGLLPVAAVRGAEAAHAEALAELAAAEQVRGATVRRLRAVVGAYPGGGPDPDLPERLPDAPAGPPAGIPADLVARRPDVAAAERRAAASLEFTRIARRARYPSFPLTGSLGTSTARLGQLTDGNFSVWSLIAGIAAPVFDGGRIRAAIRRSEAEDAAALAAYLETVLNAYAEVEGALDAETRLREREQAAVAARDAALAGARSAAARHRAGTLGALERDEAERAADRAEAGVIEARRARLENRVNLFLALGGGFERPDAREWAAAR